MPKATKNMNTLFLNNPRVKMMVLYVFKPALNEDRGAKESQT